MKRTAAARAALMAAFAASVASIGGVTPTASSANFQQATETRTSANPHVYTQQRGTHSTSSTEFAGGAWARLRSTRRRRSGYGWTNAHQKRVATKARNVKRHRASKKG